MEISFTRIATMFPQLRMGSSFCKTEQMTPYVSVWQVGSSRHCYAEEIPGIVEEVQTGQVNISKHFCSWKQQADQNLLDQVMKANVGMSGRKKI